jgi:tRNA A-37 threonylcarbamoyl transferase component Bud32
MEVREVPTPQPLLYLEQRRFRALFKSYFVTEMISGAQTLDSCVTAGFVHFILGQKLSLVRNIALHVKLMHERGICHGDLKAKNILVQEQGEGQIKVFFVDLDAVRVADKLTFRHRCRDIARLNCSFLNTAVVSMTHRLYFLKCYLGRVRRKDLKTAWDTVMFFTERKLHKSGRSFTGS